MADKRAATCMAQTLAVILLFVFSGEAESSGFVVSEFSDFDQLPEFHYLQDPTTPELKKRIVSALKTLSINAKQPCLVQYWAATKAGKTYLLTTTHQPFGTFGSYGGLELYRKACLHHKLYVHREGKSSFGLPGHAFEHTTPHQTQNMHDYPEDQRPPCENKAIFSKKWGSFVVPVILDNECVGVLEFVDTEPTHTYDGDINEVHKALKCAGFESFNMRGTIKDTHIPNKRQRKTNSSIYKHYNVFVPLLGMSKAMAIEMINRNFFPKKQTETTSEATHIPDYSAGKSKKVKKEFQVIESTFTNAYKHEGITEWPFIRKTTSKASCAPKTQTNPMASAASSFRSRNADDLTSCFVQEEASKWSLERTTITNTSALETHNDCSTSYTDALPHETTYLDAHDHFVQDNDLSETRTDQTLLDRTSSFGSPNADNLTSCLVQGEASEKSFERITITNISALETQNDQIISCSTSHTEALPESEYARPNFLPEDNTFECQEQETAYLDALDSFPLEIDYIFPLQEIPSLSESRTAQTLCDETSYIDNAGDLNSSCWDNGVDSWPSFPPDA